MSEAPERVTAGVRQPRIPQDEPPCLWQVRWLLGTLLGPGVVLLAFGIVFRPLALHFLLVYAVVTASWFLGLVFLRELTRPAQIARFARWVWSPERLWLVILIPGIYIALFTAATDMIGKPAGPADLTAWFGAAKELLLALFLSAVVEVMCDQIALLGAKSRDINQASNKLREAQQGLNGTAELVMDLKDDLTQLAAEVRASKLSIQRYTEDLKITLPSLAGLVRTTQRLSTLTVTASQLEATQEGALLGPLKTAIGDMSSAMNELNEHALHALLPPDVDLPSEGKDTVADISKDMQENETNRPHYSAMAAATAKYLVLESQERLLRGAILEPTSFAFYVHTVKAVVEALKPWWDRYEFYTLMPECPLKIFRFGNSIDMKLWLEFLQFYARFQAEGSAARDRRSWRRYFGFFQENAEANAPVPATGRLMITRDELTRQLREGYVVTRAAPVINEWVDLPAEVHETDRDRLLGQLGDEVERRVAMTNNPLHGGRGTISVQTHRAPSVPMIADFKWQRLADCLSSFHGGRERVAHELRFRDLSDSAGLVKELQRVDDLRIAVGVDVRLRGNVNPMTGGQEIERIVEMPSDLFAVRDRTATVPRDAWVLLVGRDPGYLNPANEAHAHHEANQYGHEKSRMRLTSSFTFDLATLARGSEGNPNQAVAHGIQDFLERLFRPEGDRGLYRMKSEDDPALVEVRA